MKITELPRYDDYGNMLAFHGKQTTGYDGADSRTDIVRQTFGIPEEQLTIVLDLPAPEHVQEHVQKHVTNATVIVGDHGDGGRKASIEAVTGVVLDDPEASKANFQHHLELAQNILYVPIAGGNANNFALSALDRYAQHPQLLIGARDLRVAYHRPLLYSVTNAAGNVIRFGCASTCVGLGAAAVVAARLDEHKPALKQLSEEPLGKQRRLKKEMAITASGFMKAEPFKAAVQVKTGKETDTETFDELAGIEIINSEVYAKKGRAQVNIDDPNVQTLISRHRQFAPARAVGLLAVSGRLMTGLHPAKRRLDFTDTTMSITLFGNHVVPFHVEGEIGAEYQLEPGQTLHLKLGSIAVPVLMKE